MSQSETAQHSVFFWVRRAIVPVMAILLLIYLIGYIDWVYFLALLSQLSPVSVLMAFGLYLALNSFRVMRYRVLLSRHDLNVPFFVLIGLYHNFLVRVLPFRLGEFAYPYLLKRHFQIGVEDALGSLMGARLLELLVVSTVWLVAMLSFGAVDFSRDIGSLSFVVLFIVTGIVILYASGYLLSSLVEILRGFERFPQTLLARLDALARRLDILRQPQVFVMGLFWSCFTYACSFGINWVLLVSMGVDIPFNTVAIIVSLGMFASAFPFSISGFGMMELGWALGLTTFAQFAMPEATAIGFTLNVFNVGAATLSGMLGYILLRYFAGRAALNNG